MGLVVGACLAIGVICTAAIATVHYLMCKHDSDEGYSERYSVIDDDNSIKIKE